MGKPRRGRACRWHAKARAVQRMALPPAKARAMVGRLRRMIRAYERSRPGARPEGVAPMGGVGGGRSMWALRAEGRDLRAIWDPHLREVVTVWVHG